MLVTDFEILSGRSDLNLTDENLFTDLTLPRLSEQGVINQGLADKERFKREIDCMLRSAISLYLNCISLKFS